MDPAPEVLEAASDRLLPVRLRRCLRTERLGRVLVYRASVDSTNDVARRLGRQGGPDGAVVVADEQRAGRGRRRRAWASPAGRGLYVSVLLRPPEAATAAGPACQLVAGIAVAEALVRYSPLVPGLRWPNDCYIGERKVAGVLVEAEITGGELDFLVCGMGVNINHRQTDFPVEVAGRATSLRLLTGHPTPRLPVLVELLAAFERWDGAWRRHGLAPVCERWLELSPDSRGGRVEVQLEDRRLEGVAEGLSDSGALRVRVDGVVQEVHVGEVVRLSKASFSPTSRSDLQP